MPQLPEISECHLSHPLHKHVKLVGGMGMSRLFCFHSPDSPEVLREKLEQWITEERWKGARQALSDGRWSGRVRWRRKGRFTLKEKHWRAGETGI